MSQGFPLAAARAFLSVLCLCGSPLSANLNLHIENQSRSRWHVYLDPRKDKLLVFPGGVAVERRMSPAVRDVPLEPGQRLTLTRPTPEGPEFVTVGLFDSDGRGRRRKSRTLHLWFPKQESKGEGSPRATVDPRIGNPHWIPCVVDGDTVRIIGDGWDPPVPEDSPIVMPAGRGVKRQADGADPNPQPPNRHRPEEPKEPGKDIPTTTTDQVTTAASPAVQVLTLTNASDATWTFALDGEPSSHGVWGLRKGRSVRLKPSIQVVLPVAETYRLPPRATRFLPMRAGETPITLRIWDATNLIPRGFALTGDTAAGFTLRQGAGPAAEALIRRTLRLDGRDATLLTAAWDPALAPAPDSPPGP